MATTVPLVPAGPPAAPAPPQQGARVWLGLIAAAATGAALAGALLPLLPTLAGSLAGATPHAYWYISRACAFVAFGLLWLSMLAGLGITGGLARRWPSLPGAFELHRFTALLGLGFAATHALVLLGDAYSNYSLGQLLTPFFAGDYRPVWVGFGQVEHLPARRGGRQLLRQGPAGCPRLAADPHARASPCSCSRWRTAWAAARTAGRPGRRRSTGAARSACSGSRCSVCGSCAGAAPAPRAPRRAWSRRAAWARPPDPRRWRRAAAAANRGGIP